MLMDVNMKRTQHPERTFPGGRGFLFVAKKSMKHPKKPYNKRTKWTCEGVETYRTDGQAYHVWSEWRTKRNQLERIFQGNRWTPRCTIKAKKRSRSTLLQWHSPKQSQLIRTKDAARCLFLYHQTNSNKLIMTPCLGARASHMDSDLRLPWLLRTKSARLPDSFLPHHAHLLTLQHAASPITFTLRPSDIDRNILLRAGIFMLLSYGDLR